MTYSIVARDDVSGELGVAVETCMLAVGSLVPWARAGVGAVATQAIHEPVGAENSSGHAEQVFRATRSGPWRADRT
jgi:uncharacterized Ntn-hydrolase superfamily protein